MPATAVEQEHRVTPRELFFDLVFVFAFTQVTTLLAHDPMNFKGIVYEMRFDAVSAQYAEFGEFYIGLQLPLDEIFRRVVL